MERKRSVRRRRYHRPFGKKCKELCRQFVAFMFSNVGIIGLVISYTVAGAFIFRLIERKYVLQVQLDMARLRNETAAKLWQYTKESNPFEEKTYKATVQAILARYQNRTVSQVIKWGYNGPSEDYSSKWSFAGAFLYSLTVITTIGYGNISAHTVEGKVTTIVYAIVGMPLFLLYLSNIGDVMARSFKWLYANLCLCRWCPGVAQRRAERKRRRSRQRRALEEAEDEEGAESRENSNSSSTTSEIATTYEGDEDEDAISDYDVQTVTVPLTICLLIMVTYICGGALLFCKWEQWEFLDASYFCFISLSTIGFGDLVPGEKIYGHGGGFVGEVLELSFIFCSMYLMLGMALIAMCFNLMQEEVVHKVRTIVRTFKNIMRCNT